MHESPLRSDVLIVGSGPVAAVFARLLAESGRRVTILEAGPALDPGPGSHLLNLHPYREDPDLFLRAVSARLVPLSVPVSPDPPRRLGTPAHIAPEEGALSVFNPGQDPKRNLPATATCPGVGGMGTVWSCLAPRPHPEIERWPGIPASEWDAHFAEAEALLQVGTDRLDGSARQKVLAGRLRAGYGRAPAGPAPLAAVPEGSRLRWTGPAEILGAAASTIGSVEIRSQHLVRRLHHRSGRVQWADVLDLASGRTVRAEADVFLVAAGAVQTPQLLWVSEILKGETSPLGRYLTDHPLAFARLVLSEDIVAEVARETGLSGRVPIPGGDPPAFLSIPLQRDRPFWSFLLQDKMDLRILEGRLDRRLLLNLYWYALAEPRPENRVRFLDGTRDLNGLPKPVFEYALSGEEKARVEGMLEDLREVGAMLGSFLPLAPPQLLSPGSSMHLTGTTRMGESDDGTCATDDFGRVWGFENLYLGGTGLISTATAVNPTLTAIALAVHTVRRIGGS